MPRVPPDDAPQPIADTVAQSRLPTVSAKDVEIGRVLVVDGPDQGKTFGLDRNAPSRLLLGTSPVCDLRLTDPTVSRRHVALDPVGPRYKITDLGSTNGTNVDGVPIVEAFLRGGSTVCCGATTLRFEAGAAVEQKAPPSAMRF